MMPIRLRDIDHLVLRVRDIEAMRRFYCDVLGAEHVAWRPHLKLSHLRAGNYTAWRDKPLKQMEEAGQQEVLNWTCLAGAMNELRYKADILDWVETWTFNAPKCLAVFRPV